MKKFAIITIFVLVGFNISIFAQKLQKEQERVVVEFGKNKITSAELEKAFKKNMSRSSDNLFKLSKDSIYDFINLYTNFRLKVADAIERGFLNDSSVKQEIQQNRKILAESFYYDKILTEPNVNYSVKMREKEYLVAIILANIKQNATMIDTTDAYKKITNAQQRIKNGESFEQVAREMSDDFETGKNGGLIPNYITVGKVQRPIENAIFATKAGSVYPEIVKTNYGYFLIKVLKVEERKLIRARHILININETRDSATSYKTADSLLTLLKAGANFDKLAKDNSEDVSTAVNGGDLGGYYSRSTGMEVSAYPLVQEFEKTIFELKDGEISNLVKSNYGYHIVKRDATKLPDPKVEYEELRKLYKRLYFKTDQTNLIDSLLKMSKFKAIDENIYQLVSFLDTNGTNIPDGWDKNVPERILTFTLFENQGKKFTIGEFVEKLNKDSKFRGTPLNYSGIRKACESIAEPEAFAEVTKNLEKEYHEFDILMKEFRDGILLFKVEALEVWDRMKFDSTLARTYYDSTSSRYVTEDAYDISEIYFLDKQTADSVYKRITAGEDFEVVASNETQRSGYREKKGHWGRVNVKTNSLAREAKDKNASKGQILPPIVNEPGFSIIRVNEHLTPRKKTFEEAIPDFSPQYQEILQQRLSQEWLNKIKKKLPVKINDKEVNKLISENN
jgi:peptidyl-prolyl cis-trans isomerase SurA